MSNLVFFIAVQLLPKNRRKNSATTQKSKSVRGQKFSENSNKSETRSLLEGKYQA